MEPQILNWSKFPYFILLYL